MNCRKTRRRLCFALLSVFLASPLLAQTNCEEGNDPVSRTQSQRLPPQEIIRKFAVGEALFKEARNNYAYTQDTTVQTLDGKTVNGEFRQVSDITYDDKGNRVENVTFASPDSLVGITMTKEDFDNIRNRLPFVLIPEDLPLYDVLYAGRQHLDEIDAYLFDVAPKKMESNRHYFRGRIWVDDRDLQIVKTCGKDVTGVNADGEKKGASENAALEFETYREQIDGQYWFPIYSRADGAVHLQTGDVHIREIIKYTRYKRRTATRSPL